MPSRLSPFFWQGIQREILLGEGEVEEPAPVAAPRRTALRPVLYALAALVLLIVTVFAAAAFFGGHAPAPAGPGNEIVRTVDDGSGDALSPDVPIIRDDSVAPAGAPDQRQKEVEL